MLVREGGPDFDSRRMTPKTPRLLCFAFLVLAGSAPAALIVSEDFDYRVGVTLTNVDFADGDGAGGKGFSGPWANTRADVIVEGLTDASRSASPGGGRGGAVLVSVNATGRIWDGTVFETDDGSDLWFSILFSTSGEKFNGAIASRLMLFSNGPSMSSGNGFGFELATAGKLVARLGSVTGTRVAAYEHGRVNFVLGRYVNSRSGYDTLQIWVNPSAEQLAAYAKSGNLEDLGRPGSFVEAAVDTVTFSPQSGVFLRADPTVTTHWTADELRVGTEFSDVAAAR